MARYPSVRLFGAPRTRIVSAFAVAALVLAGTFAGGAALAAPSDNYPSWADVQAARNDTVAKQAEITKIQGLITQQKDAVTSANALAVKRGIEAQNAQDALDQQTRHADQFAAQADAARVIADRSKLQAGQLAARLARAGGAGDLSTTIFFSGDKAANLLSQLGMDSLVKNQAAGLYARATQDEKVAQSLTDQANVAKGALKALSVAATSSLADAASAATQALSALTLQQANVTTFQAQLATLKTNQDHVASEYAASLIVVVPPPAPPLSVKVVASTGWARPAGGHISQTYGFHVHHVPGANAFHDGVDLGNPCNAPIYAAHSGTVIMAGPYGTLGNYIRIQNDGGTFMTAYAHIIDGGMLVGVGQHVSVGQNIARVGMTGGIATGCHLHFEVYQNGSTIDPVPFMRSQGIELAN